jgi:halocyanin-like protein
MTDSRRTTRRAVLSGVAVGVATLAGCAGTESNATPETGRSEFGDWLSGVDGYDGIVDATGQSLVTVTVGPGRRMVFDPAAVLVDTGTTVRWKWAGGPAHNVVAADGSFESAYRTETGATFERVFDDGGVVKYLCLPHEYAGMRGVVVVV